MDARSNKSVPTQVLISKLGSGPIPNAHAYALRFLRKYVYFRVIRLDLTPVDLEKLGGPGNEPTATSCK